MASPTPTPTDSETHLVQDERWALVLRIATGPYLGKAAQLRELLLYLGKKAILSPNEDVTEREIGCRVLGRRSDYNPQEDNIVRVQIRRLRLKLDEYFMTDGWNEPLVISIPKGSHVLRFDPRPRQEPVEPLPVTPPAAAGQSVAKQWRWLLVPALALLPFAFLMGRVSATRSVPPAITKSDISPNPLWSRVFLKDQPTSIVIADSSVVILQNLLQQNLTLNDYINRSYQNRIEAVQNPGMRDALRMISSRQYTSLADATLSSELRSTGLQMGARVAVRYARHLHVRDFNSGNFILIGSSHSVPWVELFEPSLNFHFEQIGKEQRFGFRNRRPAKGEPIMYASTASSNEPQESFATISLLPNLARNGTVLMLAGVTMEATEAAGEFAMSEAFSQVLTKILSASAGQKLPYFEILLKSTSMAGAPHKVAVLSWRKINI